MTTDNGRDAPDAGANSASDADSERERAIEAAVRAGVAAAEIADHVGTLVRVRADRAELRVRRSLARLAAAILLGAGLVAGIAAAGVHVVSGVSGGVAAVFGGRAWLGDLLGGALVLAAIGLAVRLGAKRRARRDLAGKEAEYEERRRRRERRFGGAREDAAASAH
jgi:hypothetical protein